MPKRDGGEARIYDMLKFNPLLVSAASAAAIAEICAHLDVLDQEEEDEEDIDTAENEEVKAVLALQPWKVRCNECCEAQEVNTRVVVAKAQAELQRTENILL
ncbi:hypothetical protein V7S43_016670 [Phytophthora oleae]|uniref:Uncharacterized protein n=1 Tax=Phytophthora oleae TaxID=2107226 RepID=A0ABD3EVD4_9STRA